MVPKRRTSQSEHGLLPPVQPPPMLQRKSSSVSVLDITGGAVNGKQNGDLPRVDRNTGSLQDIQPIKGDSNAKYNSPDKQKKKKKPKYGWSNDTGDSLPMVAKVSSSQGENKSKLQQTRTRRRRAGDIQLTRPATIAVVVKYQLGQHELKKFKSCFKQIDLECVSTIYRLAWNCTDDNCFIVRVESSTTTSSSSLSTKRRRHSLRAFSV